MNYRFNLRFYFLIGLLLVGCNGQFIDRSSRDAAPRHYRNVNEVDFSQSHNLVLDEAFINPAYTPFTRETSDGLELYMQIHNFEVDDEKIEVL
jgi:hypothetical protein